MKKIYLTISLIFFCRLSFAQNNSFSIYNDSLKLKKDNDAIIADFESSVKKIDSPFSFKGLKTVVENNSSTGYYAPKANVISLPWWETMPQIFKDFGTNVTGSKEKGEQLSKLYYYGFFLPHEIGHGLQFITGKRLDNDYDNEYEANVIALLYWREKGKKKELKQCYKIAKQVLQNLPNPIPKGEDPKTYFTKHYEVFAQDPNKYGYIMFYQIVTAFEDKSLPNFDTYVKGILDRQ